MSNIVYNKIDISEAASYILSVSNSKLLSFRGVMGAGKTTLIKALVQKLGGVDMAASPTFSLINEYRDHEGNFLAYHMDCYRIENVDEALDFGIEEYLDANCWVFVEWPERIESLLPVQRTEVRLTIVDPSHRKLEVENVSL